MTATRQPIPVRRPELDFSAVPNHWFGGNAVATHAFNGMNLVFPDGERFFIEAVRDSMGDVEDPELRQQIRGFFGQEGRHAHEHERYFEALESQRYELGRFLARFQRYIRAMSRILPASLRLAVTAGAEHYTAVFGAIALSDEELRKAHPEMLKLIVWHATEEIEHKAVAFDVLRATHPSYVLRMLGFAIATLSLFGWSIAGTRMLLRQDVEAGRSTAEEVAAHREEFRAREAQVGERFRTAIRAYLRRDFHPSETDELPQAHARLAELGMEAA